MKIRNKQGIKNMKQINSAFINVTISNAVEAVVVIKGLFKTIHIGKTK